MSPTPSAAGDLIAHDFQDRFAMKIFNGKINQSRRWVDRNGMGIITDIFLPQLAQSILGDMKH